MNIRIIERERQTAVARAKAIISGDQVTDESRTEFDAISEQVAKLDADLTRAKAIEQMEISSAKPIDTADLAHRRARREFSITLAIRDHLGRLTRTDDPGFEREIQQELRSDRALRFEGIPAPLEALETRAPVVTTAGGSANILPEDYRPDMYIPALRDSLVAGRLGVTQLSGLSGDLEIPKANAVTAAGWAAETGAFAETTPTFQQLTMSPKKAGAWSEWSQQMVLQSDPGIEGLLRADLAQTMARLVDTAVIYGTGASNQPTGVQTAITNTARAADTNGKALTFAEIQALIELLETRNLPAGDRAFLLAPRTKFDAMDKSRFATDGDRGAELAYQNGALLGERAVVSNMVNIAETHGTASTTTSLFYGQWSDMILGYWQGLDIAVNPWADTSFKRATILIRAMLFCDLLIRRDESFAYYDAILAG